MPASLRLACFISSKKKKWNAKKYAYVILEGPSDVPD